MASRRMRPGVAAGHASTAQAGADLLSKGGHAVDAAVGMMLVSCAAEMIYTGLGGGGFATCYEQATGEVSCVDFFVSVPGLDGKQSGTGMAIEVLFAGQQMPYEIGPATVAVPGVPAGAHHLWRRWGRLPWAEVVEPALIAAREGTPFPKTHARLLPRVAPAMCVGDGAKVYQRPDGSYLQAGDRLHHPDLHRGFELLLDEPEAFYRGEYADALVAALADGGALGHEDLHAYTVVESTPRTAAVDGLTVYARGNDLDDVLGTLDHASEHIPGDPLTDPESALRLVDALRAPAKRAETTNIVVVDDAGNGCAITTSLGLGSGVWVRGFGVHLNSMMGEGELVREQLKPGVRMGSMMSPLVGLDDDGLAVIAGAAGGSRIRSALVQCLLRMLRGETPQQAIDAPRLNALPTLVRLEPGFAPDVVTALQAAGHQLVITDHRDAYFGGVSAITALGGGADPRRSGWVIMLGTP